MIHSKLFFPLIGLPLLVASCSNSGVEEEINPVETKIISLSVNEESTSITEEPLLKAPAKAKQEGRIYAVNVYSKAEGQKEYSKYAYGLFDDPSQMSIALQTGSTYRFECSESRDDQESIYHDGSEYLSPYRHGGLPTVLENQFILSSTQNFDYLVDGSAKGWVNLTATDSIRCPRLYRYYALVDNFDPSTSESVNIDLRRSVFGLHLVIAPPSDGTISLTYLFREANVSAGDEAYDHEAVYSFNQISRACTEGYSGNFPFALTWTRADGTQIVKSTSITLKRNVMTTLNVSVEGKDPTGFHISEEDTEMGKETQGWVVKQE